MNEENTARASGEAEAGRDQMLATIDRIARERDEAHALAVEKADKLRATRAERDRVTRERDDARAALSVRYALAREVEVLLGVPDGPAGPEQLAAGVAAVRALVAERDRLAAALRAAVSATERGGQ